MTKTLPTTMFVGSRRPIMASLLALGVAACAAGEDRMPVEPHDPPPTAAPSTETTNPQGRPGIGDEAKPAVQRGGVERALSARVPELSLELIDALMASSAVSDHADSDYARKVNALRALPQEHSGRLRLALRNLADREHTLRHRMIQLLGDVGSQREDAEVLESFATAPHATPASTAGRDAHERTLELAEQPVTTWLATFALSQMARRGSGDARQSLSRLLTSTERDIAVSAAIEIYQYDRLSESEKKVLSARQIPTRFEPAPPEESRIQVEDIQRVTERVAKRGLQPPAISGR